MSSERLSDREQGRLARKLLVGHIAAGIEMIKDSRGLEAYRHFRLEYSRPDEVDRLRLDIAAGLSFPIHTMKTDAELVENASFVASKSHANRHGVTIGSWHTGDFVTKELRDTAKYNPRLAAQFYQEVGTIAAEEWLHVVQEISGESLAGQQDLETDVAAYLLQEGVPLSFDYVTRYTGRAAWFMSEFPRQAQAVDAFSAQHGRYI